MTQIEFKAVFQPKQRKFCVSVRPAGGKAHVERMTIAKFIRMARETTKPLVVDGVTIVFEQDENGTAEKAVRGYLKMVADSYIAAKWKPTSGTKPENN